MSRARGRRNESVRIVERRILDGPNLYFTRPAVKLTLAVPGWLHATPERVARAASALGVHVRPAGGARGRSASVGAGGTEARRRFVSRMIAQLTRSLAAATGARLAVRARSGPNLDQLVVAFPWRRRGAAEALAGEVAAVAGQLLEPRRSVDRAIAAAATRLLAVEPGPGPTVVEPTVPVVAVTGTNGKTTTVRLLAHLVWTARKSVAYSSTDGVYRDGELVEEGDYSGFGGAARALAQPDIDVAVLETARGGILLRGIGTLWNDVAVVTNVSADHLDLHGIRTIDQLAEVKSTITRITRPHGWDVLNADDPRVLAMRRGIRGRPWLFSMDPDHPALRAGLDEGGRATTVIDGWLTVLGPRSEPRRLVPLLDVPMTMAGVSTNNTRNAMAGASAGIAVGLPERAVVRGLRTFVLDEETNPGRANVYELDGRVVVIDYAHNPAGMAGMVELCRGVRPPRGEIWLAFGTAGDRTDEILHELGYTAARGTDHVVIAELLHYLRGRDRQDLVDRLRAGAQDGGAVDVPVFEDEVRAMRWMLDRARPDDVVAVTALDQRTELFELLRNRGASRVDPKRLRAIVRRARSGRAARVSR
jgi:cyanophycin synthetase